MTVPPGFQRMVIPPVLKLHRKRLPADDVGIKYGVRVTKPLKTIIDLVKGTRKPSLADIRNDSAHGYPFDGFPWAGMLELVRDLVEYAYRHSLQHSAA